MRSTDENHHLELWPQDDIYPEGWVKTLVSKDTPLV